MTIRQEIFTKVVTQLQRIKTINTYTVHGKTLSYETNAGNSVHPWRSANFDPEAGDTLPALVPRDLDELRELSDKYGMAEKRSIHIQVAIVASGTTSADEMRKIFGDLDGAFGEGRATNWDNTAAETRPRLSRTIADQESLKITGGIYEVYIDYATPAFLGRTS